MNSALIKLMKREYNCLIRCLEDESIHLTRKEVDDIYYRCLDLNAKINYMEKENDKTRI